MIILDSCFYDSNPCYGGAALYKSTIPLAFLHLSFVCGLIFVLVMLFTTPVIALLRGIVNLHLPASSANVMLVHLVWCGSLCKCTSALKHSEIHSVPPENCLSRAENNVRDWQTVGERRNERI